MKRISTVSNPTGLKKIDRNKIVISVNDNHEGLSFNLTTLNLADLGLKNDFKVICIARAGKTSKRFDMGTVGHFDSSPKPINELDKSNPLRFRILIRESDNPKLLASAENLRPRSDEDIHVESLIPVDCVDLGELVWQLEINSDGPILKVNTNIFPHAGGVMNYPPFTSFVLPEAFRNVLGTIAKNSRSLTDQADWMSDWSTWLEELGVGHPPEDRECEDWINGAVEEFCRRHKFVSKLQKSLMTMKDD